MTGAHASAPTPDYTAWVEPRLGTTQTRWLAFSSACRPFGLVNLSPDTRLEGDWGCGYAFDDDTILGFSHVHDWQIGALLVMPALGPVDPRGGPHAWASPFSHAEEVVRPGYHRVQLRRWGIAVELTATTRVGLHRCAFPASREAAIVLDLASALGPSAMGEAALRRLDPRRLEGSVVNLPTRRRPKPLRVYFALALDQDATLAAYRAATPLGDVPGVDSEQLRARLDLGRPTGPVTLQVAVLATLPIRPHFLGISVPWCNQADTDGQRSQHRSSTTDAPAAPRHGPASSVPGRSRPRGQPRLASRASR